MGKKKKAWGVAIALLVVLIVTWAYLASVNIPVLEPKGVIADKEYRLLLIVTGIMCIVVVPVFVLLGYIVWKYRVTNKTTKKYMPDWDSSPFIEGLWWAIPSIIIVVLSVITWNATYALNPYNPIASKNKTLNVQVIALDWKWLFIYPSQNVASVNKLMIPVNTPIHFYLTSDAPMNSFWVPQLSGQIYAMPGMKTQLYFMADKIGHYKGWSANISGIGFASMMFDTQATSSKNFAEWTKKIKSSAPPLSYMAYDSLARPSSFVPVSYYSHPANGLFNREITKYMAPASGMGM